MLNVSSSDSSPLPPLGLYSMELQEQLRSPSLLMSALSQLQTEEPLLNPWRHVKAIVRSSNPLPKTDHAAPLSPLRDRDFEALASWFDQEDIAEILADVNYHLALLCPEPCWEDDWNFLEEHLGVRQ